MSKWILAAIDGTGSRTWRHASGDNSHVMRFERAFNPSGGRKKYFDGPSDGLFMNIVGSPDSNTIRDAVQAFIAESLVELLPVLRNIPHTFIIEKPTRTVRDAIREAKVNLALVGHSRGGAIAINVAETLPIPVRFLGLFDAVDRAMYLSTDTVRNVSATYHAIRHPSMGSRDSFGNTGLQSEGRYKSEKFMTSHGGVGGDPAFHPSGFGDDYACSTGTVKAGVMSMMGFDIKQLCHQASINAYEWMLKSARAEGLPI